MECSNPTCPTGRQARTKGLCNACYEFLRKRGTLDRCAIAEDRLARRIRRQWRKSASGCWLWTGTRDTKGYGRLRYGGRTVFAHRFMYERMVGPIPDGLQIDHLCRVKCCVNPEHLEAVTGKVNMERAKRPTCRKGHAWEGNEIVRKDGTRTCRKCSRERIAKWKRDHR